MIHWFHLYSDAVVVQYGKRFLSGYGFSHITTVKKSTDFSPWQSKPQRLKAEQPRSSYTAGLKALP